MVLMPPGPEDDTSPAPSDDSAWDRLAALPDVSDAPLSEQWLRSPDGDQPVVRITTNEPAEVAPAVGRDQRQFHVRPGPPRHARSRAAGASPDPPADARLYDPAAPEWSPDGPGGPGEPHWAPADPDELELEPEVEPPRRRRRRTGWIIAAITVPLILVGLGIAYAFYLWGQVDQVDTEGALSPASSGFTNYLIVGVDSREGVDAGLDTAAQIGLGVDGNRSDTMVLLHVGENRDQLVSLPRDLWVNIAGSGAGKLNAATAFGGAPTLIRTVQAELGIPVHHYLEVNIAGFLDVIEAVGSVTIDFPAPACDPKSGLDVRQTGPVALDSEQALAYVRSRTYTEFDANQAAGMNCKQLIAAGLGTGRGNADFGRTERQRAFLLSVFDEVAGTRNPVTGLRALSGLSDGLRVDDGMSFGDAFGLFRKLRGLDAEAQSLPVADFQAPDGSSALVMTAEADELLAGLR